MTDGLGKRAGIMSRIRLVALVSVVVALVATPSAAAPGASADGGGSFEAAATSYEHLPLTTPTTELFDKFTYQVAIPSVPDGLIPIVLNCDGERILWYGPGSLPDFMWTLRDSDSTEISVDVWPLSITGNYQPIVGDFDWNDCTDVLWYSPGPARDYVWWDGLVFGAQDQLAINGTYRPFVCYGAFGLGRSIIWYAPGSAADYIWWNKGFLDQTLLSAKLPQQVNGDYRPFCMGSGTIAWYGVGTRPDYVWDAHQGGTPTSAPVTLNDPDLRPLPRTRGDVISAADVPAYLYAPGTARDIVVGVGGTSSHPALKVLPEAQPFNLTGTYPSASMGYTLAVLATAGPAPELVRILDPAYWP